MRDDNVYVEEAVSELPQRMFPIASKEEIAQAISRAQQADTLYHDENGKLRVSEEWRKASLLDFLDWLEAHIPGFSSPLLAYNLGDMEIVKSMLAYEAEESTAYIEEIVNREYGPATPYEEVQAQVLADTLLSGGKPMTVTAFTDHTDASDRFFIPGFGNTRPQNGESVELELPQDLAKLACFRLLCALLTLCAKSPSAAFAFTTHDEAQSAEMIGVFSFCSGHATSLRYETFTKIVQAAAQGEMPPLSELTSIPCRTDFEVLAMRTAAGLAAGVQSCLVSAREHSTKMPFGSSGELEFDMTLGVVSADPLVIGEDLIGRFTGLRGPVLADGEPLAVMFENTLSVSPYVSEREATDCMVSAAIAGAGAEVLLDGGMDVMSERVCDLMREIEFGLAVSDFDFEGLDILNEHARFMGEKAELAASDEVYESLPSEDKEALDGVISALVFDPASSHQIVVLEGNLDIQDTEVKATCLALPPDAEPLPPQIAEDYRRTLRSMILNASRSANTTLLCASRSPWSPVVDVSGIEWENGKWEDVGEEKTMFYISATNLGSLINVNDGEPINYRYIDGGSVKGGE